MREAYEGVAFSPALAEGSASGAMRVREAAVHFECEGFQALLPLEGLTLRLGGANDRLVFFSHPSQPDCSVYTADHSVLDDARLLALPALAAQIGQLRRKKLWDIGVVAAVVVVFVLAIVGAFAAKDPLVGAIADRVPASVETALGDAAFAQVRQSEALLEAPELEVALAGLTRPLLAVIPQQDYAFRFHVAGDDSVNAFALPGGPVVIHRGLILKAESAEEVLGVLAHEMAHVTRRHSLRQIINTVGLFTLVQAFFGDLTGVAAVVTQGGAELLSLRFSREFEREADDVGWGYLVAARIDPRGMIGFFEKLLKEEQERGGLVAGQSALAFLSTHPTTPERIERLTAKLGELPSGVRFRPVDVDFGALEQALRPSAASEPSQGETQR